MNINKQKVLNFVLTLEAGGKKICQNILRSTWKTEYEKSNNTDNNKSKYSSNPMNILKSEKKKQKKWISTPSALLHWLSNHFHFHKWTSVSNAYISDTQTSLKQSKEIVVPKNVFFLLICLHLHLVSHQEAEILEKKI